MTLLDVSTATLRLHNGAQIPQVGLGVWQAARGQVTHDAVLAALRAGYRHIDTARVYGNEVDVGSALRDSGIPRDQVFITTKLWNDDHGHDEALRAFEASATRLGLDYIDLYLVHWPVAGKHLASWKALETLHADGRARAIGVSNYLLPQLKELLAHARVSPAVNQIELSPFLQRRETVRFCQDRGIVLAAYSPLTRGLRLGDPTVVSIAQPLGRTPAQVLLRWGIQQGFVVLPKSTQPARIAENASLFDFALSRDAVRALDALEEGLVTGWDPAEQR